jgi:hypothetical protein
MGAKYRNSSAIDTVVIHHSAVEPPAKTLAELQQRARQYDNAHKNRAIANGWDTQTDGQYGYQWISYHWLVDYNGNVLQVQDPHYVRFHCSNYSLNLTSVAICFDANSEYTWPEDVVIDAIARIIISIDQLAGKHVNIAYHGAVASPGYGTSCPGKWLRTRMNDIINKVNYYRQYGIPGPNPDPVPDPTEPPVEPPIEPPDDVEEPIPPTEPPANPPAKPPKKPIDYLYDILKWFASKFEDLTSRKFLLVANFVGAMLYAIWQHIELNPIYLVVIGGVIVAYCYFNIIEKRR